MRLPPKTGQDKVQRMTNTMKLLVRNKDNEGEIVDLSETERILFKESIGEYARTGSLNIDKLFF